MPLRATTMVLGFWMAMLLILAFVVVPAIFATCGPAAGAPGP